MVLQTIIFLFSLQMEVLLLICGCLTVKIQIVWELQVYILIYAKYSICYIGWGCVYPDQVEWYRATSLAFQNKFQKVIPGVAFYHIPNPEVKKLLKFLMYFF